jgi:hypothetical protein
VPQNYRAFLAASDLLSTGCSGKNRALFCRFLTRLLPWGLAVRPPLRLTMRRTGSVSRAAVSSSIAFCPKEQADSLSDELGGLGRRPQGTASPHCAEALELSG